MLHGKPVAVILLLLGFVWPQSLLYADTGADSPDSLAQQAVAASPDIAGIEQSIIAMDAALDAANPWPDPVFAVEYSNVPWNTWSLGDSPMSGLQFKLQQRFPLPGKNSRRQAAVQQQRRAITLQREDAALRLRGSIHKTYWQLALQRQLREVTVEHIRLVEQLHQAVSARYQAGGTGQHNLLRLELLKAALQQDVQDIDRRDAGLLAAINTARHMAPDTPVHVMQLEEAIAPPPATAELNDRADNHNPQIASLRARALAERKTAAARSYERWPDFSLWLGYRIRTEAGADPGVDFMSVGFSIPLPFDYSGTADAKQREHLARAQSLQFKAESALERIGYRIEEALLSWRRSYAQATAYRDTLIPKARQSLEATLAAYSANRADFTALYEAQLQVLQFQRVLLAAMANTRLQQVDIQTLTGADLRAVRKGESP